MLLPQLALSSELIFDVERPSAEESHNSTELPPVIELQDDVRLNKIEYTDKISQAELPSLEQTLCLLTVYVFTFSQAFNSVTPCGRLCAILFCFVYLQAILFEQVINCVGSQFPFHLLPAN